VKPISTALAAGQQSYVLFLFFHTLIFDTAEQRPVKSIFSRSLVLGWTRNIDSHISPDPPLIFQGQKVRIWPRLSILIAFKTRWV